MLHGNCYRREMGRSSKRLSEPSEETISKNLQGEAVSPVLVLPRAKRFVDRYFPRIDLLDHSYHPYQNLWNFPSNTNTMVSRKKILSHSLDALNFDSRDGSDVWFQKEKLFKDHIQEVLNKLQQIDDEIWAKVIIMERNRRVAKAYARAPVLTINGSDDGFDGYRIGLCGFDNPMRDVKTDEVKKLVGHGIKIKMDDCGNIVVKRISRSDVYVKEIKTENTPDSVITSVLEKEKPVKIFDVKKFSASINSELNKTYPDRKKLENQCMFAISFVKDSREILNCSCWVIIINVLALDMLQAKFPLVYKSSSDEENEHPQENPYSILTFPENPWINYETRKLSKPKPPKPPPRNMENISASVINYDDPKKVQRAPRQSGYKDDKYQCGIRPKMPSFIKKTNSKHQRNNAELKSGYVRLLKHEDSSESEREEDLYKDSGHKVHSTIRPLRSHSRRMFIGNWQ